MSVIAKSLIKQARDENWEKLDLGNCELVDLEAQVPELFELECLQELILSNWWNIWENYNSKELKSANKGGKNKLIKLPQQLTKLKNLTTLIACGLSIKDSSSLRFLASLKRLHLNNNEINDLNSLAFLPHLEELYLNNNKITKINALSNSKQLRILNLWNNEIVKIDALRSLTNLETLILGYNKINNIDALEQLTQLRQLLLNDNEIEDINALKKHYLRDVRISIANNPNRFSTKPKEAIVRYFLNWFSTTQACDIPYSREAKLLMIGDDNSDDSIKKLLLQKLKQNNQALKTYTYPIAKVQTIAFENQKLTVWNLDNQETYAQIQLLFLSENNLTVFCFEDTDKLNYEHWLYCQSKLKRKTPAIIVCPKEARKCIETFKRNLDVDCDIIDKSGGIDYVWDKLVPELKQHLYRCEQIPESYVLMQQKLQNLDKNFVYTHQFQQICEEEGIDEIGTQDGIAEYFHDLGLLMHYKNNPVLRRILFLKPEWVINALVRVFDYVEKQNKNGSVSFEELNNLWSTNGYESVFWELLTLMKEFQLCIEIRSDSYLLPQFLPNKIIDSYTKDSNDFNFELQYHYSYLPNEIIGHCIAKFWNNVHKDNFGHNGVLLNYNENWVKIKKKGNVLVIKTQTKQTTQNIHIAIQDKLYDINTELSLKPTDKKVPCNCLICLNNNPHLHDYDELINREGEKEIYCRLSKRKVLIAPLLGKAVNKHSFDAKKAKQLIASNKFEDFFKLMNNIDDNNELSLQKARYSYNEDYRHLGIIRHEDYLLELNQIREACLYFVDKLTTEQNQSPS